MNTAVKSVTWTATDGKGITEDHFGEFAVSVGLPDDAAALHQRHHLALAGAEPALARDALGALGAPRRGSGAAPGRLQPQRP